jgi:flavorubredoxin
MIKQIAFAVAMVLGSMSTNLTALAQNIMVQRELAQNVYMMESSTGSSNSTFFITEDGVLVFDADIQSGDQVLAAIRKLTDKKVRYLITSHASGDHSTGGWHYREDRPIIIGTRRQMHDGYMQEHKEFLERKASPNPQYQAYRSAELVKHDIGFVGAMTLQFGGLTFQLTMKAMATARAM